MHDLIIFQKKNIVLNQLQENINYLKLHKLPPHYWEM